MPIPQDTTLNPLEQKKLWKKGEFGIHHTVDAKEGDVTIVETDGMRGTRLEPILSNPLRKWDWVKLVGDNLFEKCDEADEELMGYVVSKPEWENYTPTEDTVDGEYSRRKMVVELFGTNIHTVNVPENNPEIKPGDSIKYAGNQKFTKGSNDKTRVLNTVLANTGGEADVLFGFYTLD